MLRAFSQNYELALLVFPRLARPTRNLFQTGWFRPPGLPEVLVDLIAVAHPWPGIADQLPADQARVAAVHGVAEHAFDRVSRGQVAEARTLDGLQLLVLLFGWQAGEVAELPEALP